jgi:hypothetical protein
MWGLILLASCQKDEDTVDYITFEELELDPELGYWNGEYGSGNGFQSGNAWFPTYWDDTWGEYWEGFAYTDHTLKNEPGAGNQFSSYAGEGAAGSAQYAVFYAGFYGTDTLTFKHPERIDRLSVSNSAYAALAMLNGDQFTKKFGGETGEDPDWFSVIIQGIGIDGNPTGQEEIFLADFREPGIQNDYISEDWKVVTLDHLGIVQKLVFSFASSDTAYGFINVPTYVCLDNIIGTLK